MKNWARLGLISLLSLSLASSALAVEYGGLGAKPTHPDPSNPRTQSIFVYSLNPGEVKHDSVTVYNNTNARKTVAVYAVDSKTSSGGAFACAQKVDPTSDVGSWVNLASNQVDLNAGEKQEVAFDLSVPSKADVGEHDGCLVVQDATSQAKEGGGIALSFRSALRMVVTVPGKTFKKLSFLGLGHISSKAGKEVLSPSVKNEGNVSVDADVAVSLKNILGFSAGKAGGSYPILPRSQAEWNFEIKRPFWGGFYVAGSKLTYDPSNQSLGLSGGPKSTIVGPQVQFWISPAPTAAAIELIILLGLIAAGMIWYRARSDRSHALKHWQSYTVKPSETLAGLAEARGVAWQKVAKINKIKAPFNLRPGQKLLLPDQKD